MPFIVIKQSRPDYDGDHLPLDADQNSLGVGQRIANKIGIQETIPQHHAPGVAVQNVDDEKHQLERKDQDKTDYQDFQTQPVFYPGHGHYQREQEYAVKGIMPEFRGQGLIIGGGMVKDIYIAALSYDRSGGIFFLEEFDDFFAAKGEDFRSRRFGGVPYQKRRREKYHEADYKRPDIRQLFLRFFSTRSSRR